MGRAGDAKGGFRLESTMRLQGQGNLMTGEWPECLCANALVESNKRMPELPLVAKGTPGG